MNLENHYRLFIVIKNYLHINRNCISLLERLCFCVPKAESINGNDLESQVMCLSLSYPFHTGNNFLKSWELMRLRGVNESQEFVQPGKEVLWLPPCLHLALGRQKAQRALEEARTEGLFPTKNGGRWPPAERMRCMVPVGLSLGPPGHSS